MVNLSTIFWTWDIILNVKIVLSLFLSAFTLIYLYQNQSLRIKRNYFVLLLHISFTGYFISNHYQFFISTILGSMSQDYLLISRIISLSFIILIIVGTVFIALIDSEFYCRLTLVISCFYCVSSLFIYLISIFSFFDFGFAIITLMGFSASFYLIIVCLYQPYQERFFIRDSKFMFFFNNYRNYGLALLCIILGSFFDVGTIEGISETDYQFNFVINIIANLIIIFGLYLMMSCVFQTKKRLQNDPLIAIQKQLDDSNIEKRRLESVIGNVLDGLLVLYPNGTLHLANKTFKELFSSIYFKNLPTDFNINNYNEHKLFSSIVKFLRSDSQKFIPHTIKLEEGLYFEIDCAFIKSNNEPIVNFGMIVTFRDVSKFIEYDNLRREFISTVSHELRTPITSINLSIQNLKKYHKELSFDQRNDLLDMTAKSSSLLNQMVDDLLILSRIEAREFKLKSIEFNLNETISNVLKQLEPRKQANNFSIKVDASSNIILYGDPRRIGQVIQILVDNAIKYSSANSIIKIKASDHYIGKYNVQGTDGTLISVKDRGIGIKLLDLPRIFIPFYRATEVQDIPGTGLSLSIAKRLIDLHQGKIFVASTHGKGSVFHVFLPRMDTPPEIKT